MIYNVRWILSGDSEEYRSRDYASANDAVAFACTILDQMTVQAIRVMDMSGQQIMMMPEIVRHCRAAKQR
jgi:hypothetical protein